MKKQFNFSILYVSITVFFSIILLNAVPSVAWSPKPAPKYAEWSGEKWGMVVVYPTIARHGDEIMARGVISGGPASDPWWSCSQYSHWTANGTGNLKLQFPGSWEVPQAVKLTSYNIVEASESKESGDAPPDDYSETCYCKITTFGAQGGCESREWQPTLFHVPNFMNPNAGINRFAIVKSGEGWIPITAIFSGRAGVGHVDWAIDHIYIIPEPSARNVSKNISKSDLPAVLREDTDNDGLPDIWELASSPNESLNDFAGGESEYDPAPVAISEEEWVNPYSPRLASWTPRSVNDWDGDGFSNMEEFENWWNRKKDGNGMPFDPTVINHIVLQSNSPWNLFIPALIKTKKK